LRVNIALDSTGLNPFRMSKTLGGLTIGIATNCDFSGVRAKVTRNYKQLKVICGKMFVVDVGTGRHAVRNIIIVRTEIKPRPFSQQNH
jgi:galactokinase